MSNVKRETNSCVSLLFWFESATLPQATTTPQLKLCKESRKFCNKKIGKIIPGESDKKHFRNEFPKDKVVKWNHKVPMEICWIWTKPRLDHNLMSGCDCPHQSFPLIVSRTTIWRMVPHNVVGNMSSMLFLILRHFF